MSTDLDDLRLLADFGETRVLAVLHRFPVHERVRKTALLLGRSFSIFLVEVAMLSTSPNVARSPI
jgi:hypothetical protein